MNNSVLVQPNNNNSFSQYLGIAQNLAVAGLSCAPIYLLRKGGELVKWSSFCLTKTISIGSCGENWGAKVIHTAKKLQAIFFDHKLKNIDDFIAQNIPVLCKTRNYTKIGDIWFEEDVKKYKELLKKYIELQPEHSTEDELITISQDTKIRGANTDGICEGASLSTIHALQTNNIETEDQLIQLVKQWEYGFSSEAAALQNLYEFWREVHGPAYEKDGYRMLRNFQDQIMVCELINRVNEARINFIESSIGLPLPKDRESINQAHENNLRDEAQRFKEQLRSNAHRFEILIQKIPAESIGLNLKRDANSADQIDFKDIVKNEKMKEKFDQLANGEYLLSIHQHSIVYIKRDFGSYIVDPNFGLLKCRNDTPSEKLCELLIHYRKSTTHEEYNNLKVFSF